MCLWALVVDFFVCGCDSLYLCSFLSLTVVPMIQWLFVCDHALFSGSVLAVVETSETHPKVDAGFSRGPVCCQSNWAMLHGSVSRVKCSGEGWRLH